MGKSTFNRKETKYQLDATQLRVVRAAVAAHLPQAAYGTGRVNSIYLDTDERSVIARSLEKPLYKEKLRVRWYGPSCLEDADVAFVELKKKFQGIVYKRRLSMTAAQAQAFLEGASVMDVCAQDAVSVPGASPYQRYQIAHEVDMARARAGALRPSALISCVRTSFGSDDEGALRITFDERLCAHDLFTQALPLPLMTSGSAIMEVKCLGAYPSWLIEALSRVKAYPSSFSKYGTFYEASRAQRMAPAKEAAHA